MANLQSGNGSSPPALGDIELVRKGDETWRVDRGGVTVVDGLAFAQVLQIVRGELAIDQLQGRKKGTDMKDKSARVAQ